MLTFPKPQKTLHSSPPQFRFSLHSSKYSHIKLQWGAVPHLLCMYHEPSSPLHLASFLVVFSLYMLGPLILEASFLGMDLLFSYQLMLLLSFTNRPETQTLFIGSFLLYASSTSLMNTTCCLYPALKLLEGLPWLAILPSSYHSLQRVGRLATFPVHGFKEQIHTDAVRSVSFWSPRTSLTAHYGVASVFLREPQTQNFWLQIWGHCPPLVY